MVNKGVMAIVMVALGTLLGAGELWASDGTGGHLDLTHTMYGYLAILLFVVAYGLVMTEEYTKLRKSKPVLLAAGLIWVLIAAAYVSNHIPHVAEKAMRHNILEYAELFLFLLVAMTYINAMEERLVFESLRAWLVRAGYGFRKLFWLTGILAFFISPVADNLTTALLMCAVIMAVGRDNGKFVTLACINIVVGANAGGAFSPFGDITTLMVWQKGVVGFGEFFQLFLPSVTNFLVPALIMHFAVPNLKPASSNEVILIKRGGRRIVGLFLLTILTAVSFHSVLELPPVAGMMTGLAYLKIFSYYLNRTMNRGRKGQGLAGEPEAEEETYFDVFQKIARAEWDTLMFFYGVIMCVGGLGFIGYLTMLSHQMYGGMGPTMANVLVGVLSAVIDTRCSSFLRLTSEGKRAAVSSRRTLDQDSIETLHYLTGWPAAPALFYTFLQG
ncbi:sodium:proton antiporter NhaD [Magnetococcus marinus]|nr:sodium:proton antiporter NhaD [Magnetococcus marinus]